VSLLEHERARAPFREERRGDETVVSASDHDRVISTRRPALQPISLLLRHLESPFNRVGEAYTRPVKSR